MGKPEEQEARVRPLAAAGLSTHKISAALGDMSQATVVRVLKRINSGPHPIAQPDESDDSDTEPFLTQRTPPAGTTRESGKIGWIILAALIILAMIVVSAVEYKLTQPPATTSRLPACALYSSDGHITRIALATHNHCAKGWQFLYVVPSR